MAKHHADDMYQKYMRCKIPYVFSVSPDCFLPRFWQRWTIRSAEKIAPYVSENVKGREFESAKNHPETEMWGYGR